mmetsp:Transcript_39294/g.87428  ORF Transcript_39294/g.87428 Transcript_39294/m.87428 type:complete len:166 (+) Transcript_39294:43-540(+)|eukprot:CAMPEP_0202898570 /NCGR_PEP_ID=MMETSP1392-20130828/7063_1 /ASSEMBLY_ACC=CAM_ASM_000868 /TAXON_ID=225041 /ORGANISM="Chlamydomonas chlamydogama, Strain SAG 11-48b" /LENGTH=165 /DNA_ID=CAMNT_0049584537 /DNA_START=50 /DNA_END=547 /DNA_ORIENTATION=+
MLPMNHLPVIDASGSNIAARAEVPDWGKAAGNIEDAKIAVEALKSLVADAVFLDEDAYSGAVEISAYTNKLQAQQRRMRDMEHEIAALRAEVEKKDEALTTAGRRYQQSLSQIEELRAELDNNAVVFKMHYQELITRNEEIARLTALVETLGGQAEGPAATPGAP